MFDGLAQTRNVEPMLFYCRATAHNAGPALNYIQTLNQCSYNAGLLCTTTCRAGLTMYIYMPRDLPYAYTAITVIQSYYRP